MMGHNAIFLGDCQINQLIVSVRFDGIYTFLELGIKTSAETITFLDIRVSMITRVLRKVVEHLSVLKYSAGTLSKSQKLIELSFNQSF
jgi:hypothetical protein